MPMSCRSGAGPIARTLLTASSVICLSSFAAAQAPTCMPPNIDRTRSLVVTDAALDKTKFSFSNTIDAILGSLQVSKTPDNRENLLKSLITSFNADDMVNPISGLRMRVDVRTLEAALDPKKLLDPGDPTGLVPIALFNRLDLAPEDWSNCGEHRIVYLFKAPIPQSSGPSARLFLIFEARVDNTSPQMSGFEGCRPIANFWRDLSDENDVSKRAQRLEDFYYKGIPGVSGPVVQAKNYGGPLGQVRGNLFVNAPGTPPLWQLREWIVINAGQPTPASFVPVTVKENPLAEFYQDANSAAGTPTAPLDAALEATERVEFQKQFNNTTLTRLIEPDVVRQFLTDGQPGYKKELDPKSTDFNVDLYKIDILNRIGARFQNRFNEFQSVSQGNSDNPTVIVSASGPNFKASVATTLNTFVIDAAQKPNEEQVFNRAGAVTCGGCHQFSQGQTAGVGIVKGAQIAWPASATFVHTTEDSTLSPALRDVFLPFRQDRLGDAVCIPAAPPPPALVASAPRALSLEVAQRSRWQQLVSTAREEKDPATRATRTREAVQAITVQRQEELQKPGYFVTNRRPH
jgi:hypothetical protein